MNWRRTVLVATALTLVAAACGDGDVATTTTAPPTTATTATTVAPTTPTTAAPTTTATTTTSSTTTVAPTTTTSTTTTTVAPTTTTSTTTTVAPTTTTLPGEPFDMGFPQRGDVLGVIGVSANDVLNVRSGPGTTFPVVARLVPLTDDVVATGRARLLTRSIWWEVMVDGTTGWASSRYLAYLAATDDTTSRYVDALGGIPVAETMQQLGLLIANEAASEDPPSRIVMSVAPTVGDLGEVTYDVVGLGDDSVVGIRLHVFGEPSESGEGFSLKAVESTELCGRGSAGGICV